MQPQQSPRLHPFIASRPAQPVAPLQRNGGSRVLSPTKPTLHLSPRKFQQLQQQQRQAVFRGMLPLSPIKRLQVDMEVHVGSNLPKASLGKDPVPWSPAWLPFPIDEIPVTSAKAIGATALSYGKMSLDAWLESFDHDILQYESLERFVQVKLPEAMAFCDKMEQQLTNLQEQERLGEASSQLNLQRSLNGKPLRGTKIERRLRVTSAMTRFPVRFRVAVFASLMERAIVSMTQSAALGHLKPWLLQARQELFRAVFADYDQYSAPKKRGKSKRRAEATTRGESSRQQYDEGETDDESDGTERDEGADEASDEKPAGTERLKRTPRSCESPNTREATSHVRFGPETPRPLSFFLSRVPYILKHHDDSQKRAIRFQRHQVVLRRILQSLYRSMGTVFHAWKIHARQRHEERLNDKGAQLTAMVMIQRGLIRTIFVEWSKCALKTKLLRVQEREVYNKRVHDERVNDLHRELFLLREQNARLERDLDQVRRGGCDDVLGGVEDEEDAANSEL